MPQRNEPILDQNRVSVSGNEMVRMAAPSKGPMAYALVHGESWSIFIVLRGCFKLGFMPEG